MNAGKEKSDFRRENKESADFFCPKGHPGIAISQKMLKRASLRGRGFFIILGG